MNITQKKIQQFQGTVRDYYLKHYRDMPWRNNTRPYYVLVSEVMLQQTQVPRVLIKFEEFITTFPTLQSLANADNRTVLQAWSGLGYNRRGLYLKKAAEIIMEKYEGNIPETQEELVQLPGIGNATAAAILTYAYNKPIPFIETNIRTVYIHHFYPNTETVSDEELLPLLEKTMDKKNPREWNWALMDYGTHIKKTIGNLSQKSKHHIKQSKFEGSTRQVRAAIIRELLQGTLTEKRLYKKINVHDGRFEEALKALEKEGTITKKRNNWKIKE